MKKTAFITIIVIIALSSGYLVYRLNQSSPLTTNYITPTNSGLELTPITPPPTVTPSPMPQPIKERILVDDQPILIYRPQQLLESSSPLIIYSHGSNENIDSNLITPSFEQSLDNYGNYFAQQGAFFVASEMYGPNWGSRESREHLNRLIQRLNEDYNLEERANLYGFSMGGLAALRFARDYPNQVSKIALLAPTVYLDDWNQTSIESISHIPIRVWHGAQDLNIPLSSSQQLFNRFQELNHPAIELTIVEDEIHQHFLLPDQIWSFFTQN